MSVLLRFTSPFIAREVIVLTGNGERTSCCDSALSPLPGSKAGRERIAPFTALHPSPLTQDPALRKSSVSFANSWG